MRTISFFVNIILASLIFQSSVAQKITSKTLLWRISGNGLQKPSYLYGTMHLKDRRLFFFGDSVYKNIQSSDGFAMEIDPAEMMDSVFSKLSERDTTSLLRKALDKREYAALSGKLEKKLGIPADKITRKKLIEYRNNWYKKIRKKDDMQTFVDIYLYDLARKQGKWIGGIEDVQTTYEEETASYLAICGPFDVNKLNPELIKDKDGVLVFYDEKYEAANNNRLFKKFIEDNKAAVELK